MEKPIDKFIALDLETTGLSPEKDRIIEIGAIRYRNGKAAECFSGFVNCEMKLPERIVALTKITDEDIAGAPTERVQLGKFLEFVGDDNVILGHNIRFDFSFLKMAALRIGYDLHFEAIDTLKIAKKFCADMESRTLSFLCEHYGIINPAEHRAVTDAEAAAEVYFKLYNEFGSSDAHAFLPEEMTYSPKKTEPATEKQKKYLKDLLDYHRIVQDINYDTLTKSEASRRIDKIILTYGKPGK